MSFNLVQNFEEQGNGISTRYKIQDFKYAVAVESAYGSSTRVLDVEESMIGVFRRRLL